jgi:hypothetical protein
MPLVRRQLGPDAAAGWRRVRGAARRQDFLDRLPWTERLWPDNTRKIARDASADPRLHHSKNPTAYLVRPRSGDGCGPC